MKRGIQYCILAAEAFLCIWLTTMPVLSLGDFSGIAAFPFEQIGLALRSLSLPGGAGNGAAIVLYLVICLSPAAVLAFRKNRKLFPEDLLLLLLSLLLFRVLYQMINPGTILLLGGASQGLPVAKAILGSAIHSVLLGYVVLRTLRLFYNSEQEKVQRYLSVLLFLLNMLFVAAIFGVGLGDAVNSIKAMQINNSGNQQLFGINYLFVGLGFVADNLAYALDIPIVFSAIALLEAFTLNRYSDATIAGAKRLSRICGVALSVVIFSSAGFQLLQILFGGSLFNINSSIRIPLFSIAFVLVCLLLTRLVQENKALKDENDSMI